MASLEVADASEYLAITGGGLDDVKLAKKAWVWAGQQCKKKLDTTLVNYELEVHATTSDKLPLILPVVLTVGPKADEHSKASLLLLYANKLIVAPHGNGRPSHVGELVRGAVEGQARALAASMTTEEISHGAAGSFEQAVVEKVRLELDRFGLFIYNADVNVQLVGAHKVDVPTTKVEAEALENGRDDAVVTAAKASNLANTNTKMPAWVLGLCIASAAVTLVVYEAPPGVGKGAYYLAVSGAFFAAVAGVMAAVVAAN